MTVFVSSPSDDLKPKQQNHVTSISQHRQSQQPQGYQNSMASLAGATTMPTSIMHMGSLPTLANLPAVHHPAHIPGGAPPTADPSMAYIGAATENIYETAARVLFMAVKWARNIPSFLQVRQIVKDHLTGCLFNIHGYLACLHYIVFLHFFSFNTTMVRLINMKTFEHFSIVTESSNSIVFSLALYLLLVVAIS